MPFSIRNGNLEFFQAVFTFHLHMFYTAHTFSLMQSDLIKHQVMKIPWLCQVLVTNHPLPSNDPHTHTHTLPLSHQADRLPVPPAALTKSSSARGGQ